MSMLKLSKELAYPLAALTVPVVVFVVLFTQGWGRTTVAHHGRVAVPASANDYIRMYDLPHRTHLSQQRPKHGDR
jgi:hypothetical protein